MNEVLSQRWAALMKQNVELGGILEIDSEYLETGIFCPACGEVLYSPDGKQIVCCNDTCLRRYRLEEATE